MIVLVSGTNGAGKTHLVRRVLEALRARGDSETLLPDGMGIVFPRVTVIGKYGGPACGGCDTFSWKGAADDIERIAVEAAKAGSRVLLEGVIVSTWGQERLARLREYGLVVVHLTTSLDDCLGSVNDRRRARAEVSGKEFSPVKPDNVSSKHRGLLGGLAKKRAAQIQVIEADRESAFERVREMMLWPCQQEGTVTHARHQST